MTEHQSNEFLNKPSSDHFSRTVLDNIPIMVAYITKNRICQYVNKAFETEFNREGVQTLGCQTGLMHMTFSEGEGSKKETSSDNF